MEASSQDKLLKNLGVAVTIWGLLTAFDIVSMSPAQKTIAWLGLLCGFSFLGFCMAAMLQNPQRGTRVLAVVGLGCSLIFLSGPGFESQAAGTVFSIIRSGLVLAGIAAMLHFLLLFPKPGPFVAQPGNIRFLYAPAFLFWLLVSFRALPGPNISSALNAFTYILTGLVIAGYFLAGLIVFLRRYIRTPVEDRGSSGMRLMLLGSLTGFLPAAIGYMPALSSVPGNEYFFISLIVLPPAWTKAALKGH